MCYMLYIASDKALPVIEWKDNESVFFTRHLDDHEKLLSFSLPYIIYAGSYEGCGCGFKDTYIAVDPDDLNDVEDPEVIAFRKKSLQALYDYLNHALNNNSRLEIFLCWDGEQGESPQNVKILHLQDFLNSTLPIDSLELAKIIL